MSIRFLLCLVVSSACVAVPRINLFRPSDRPLMPEPVTPCWSSQLSIGYEGAFHIRAFRDTHDDLLEADPKAIPERGKKTCLFNLFQDTQNALAGFKGFPSQTDQGQVSQLFNLDDESCDQGLFLPEGCLRVPMNLMFSQRFYFDYGLRLEFHLPVIHAELKNVRWCPVESEPTFEQQLDVDLISASERLSGLNLRGWKRTGVGDFVIQAAWMREFIQSRRFLDGVRVQGRFGVIFPTGKRADEDLLLAFPFGCDGSWGVQFGGGIDLNFGCTLRGGIDAEFIYLFGNTECRRVKTDSGQTDLLFLQKASVFKEFGLGQQYNIYLESQDLWCNTSFKLNYQFLKRNDDRVDVANDRIDSAVANSAPSLFDWSAHSLIFMVNHDIWRDYDSAWVFPSIRGWIKWGFNGKRALLANTVGLQVSLNF